MKNLTKRLLAVALAFVVAVTTFVPVSAEAAPSYTKDPTVYRTSKSGNTYYSFYVDGLSKTQTIKKSGVSSSNEKVAERYGLYSSTSTYKQVYWSGSSDYSGSYYSYSIALMLKKNGTSKIKFVVKDSSTNKTNTYTSTLTVKNYENPVSSATITDINSGKNLKSKTADSNYASLTNKKDIKNAKFTVKTDKKGTWRITGVYVSGNSEYHSYTCNQLTSKEISLGTLKKNTYYYISVTFYNTKTKGSLTVYYYLNN